MEIGPWICDTCKQPIRAVKDGWVEWLQETSRSDVSREYGLRLVHHMPASPRREQGGCQYNERQEWSRSRATVQDLSLDQYVGSDGLMELLEYLAEGTLPKNEVIELIKRIHIPIYEQVRNHLDSAVSEGVISSNSLEGFHTQEEMMTVLLWAQQRGD